MNIDFLEKAKEYYQDALADLCELLKFKSVLDEYKADSDAPFGIENKKCLEYFLSLGTKDGFNVLNVDNYAGHISYGSGSESVGVLGHLDVVPAVGKWSHDPFDPIIVDGKLFARGTLDDKGGVIASYYAMKMLRDLKLEMSKEIRIIVGCDEESGSRCVERYFSKVEKPTYAFSPDAEFPIIYGEKGILSFDILGKIENSEVVSITAGERYNIVCDEARLTVKNVNPSYLEEFIKEEGCSAEVIDNSYVFYGLAAHAMQPHLGVNAIKIMFKFMDKYYPSDASSFITKYFDTTGKLLNVDTNDIDMHDLTINLGVCKYDGESLKLGYNLRVPVDSHVDVIKNGFNKGLEEYPNLSLGEFHYSPRHFVDKNSELVVKLMQAYQEITGDYESKPFTIGGGTYARTMSNAVAFGPNFTFREDICHQPDEHIYLEDFLKWIAIYAKAIYLLAK
jgi:succinyl-diaminopimelate desuccinylase